MAVVGAIGRSAIGDPGVAGICSIRTYATVIYRVRVAWRSRQQVETDIQVSAIRHLAANGPTGMASITVGVTLSIDMLIVLAPDR